MPRLKAQEKMEYYPTPSRMVELIATHIARPVSAGLRLLDPCAGKGDALAQLATLLGGGQTYGVELNTERAQVAKGLLHRCLCCSYNELRAAANSFQVSLENPPYDWQDGKRMEYLFLQHVNERGWLQEKGLLIWIVPETVARRADARKLLAGWFDDLVVLRFPEPEYSAFKQVVVFGRQRARRASSVTWDIPEDLPVLGQHDVIYELPAPAGLKDHFYFHSATASAEDLAEMAAQVGQDFPELTAPPIPVDARVRPMIPLRNGHLAMFLGAGMVNNSQLEQGKERLLVKGRTIKTIHQETQDLDDNTTRTVQTEQLVSRVCVIDLGSGEIRTLEGEEQLKPFFTQWIEPLATAVQTRFQPLYNFELPPDLAPVFASLSKNRRLPGRKETGLFPAQGHAGAAIVELERQGANAAILVGEMGTGKTTVGIVVAAGLHQRKQTRAGQPVPFLGVIMCPGHLTEKWKREAREVWPGVYPEVIDDVAQMGRLARRAFSHPGVPHLAIISKEMAKLGPGWQPAYNGNGTGMSGRDQPFLLDTEASTRHCWVPEGSASTWLPWNPHLWRRQQSEPTTYRGEPGHWEAWTRLEWSPRGGWSPINALAWTNRYQQVHQALEDGREQVGAKKESIYRCPDCGSELVDDEEDPLRRPDYLYQQPRTCPECGAALWQYMRRFEREGNPRWPIADYVARCFAGQVDLFIADEVHQNQAQSTDQGYAFGNLINASRFTLALTGTIFGGQSSSIFYLLHRLGLPQVRTRYAWNEVQRWIQHYGVLETTITEEKEERSDRAGCFTANKRTQAKRQVRELPGISPLVVPLLLNSAIFLRLQDLGYKLPPYREFPILLDLSKDQATDYLCMDVALTDAFREDRRLLSAWLQATLGRPNSCWRDDLVTDPEGGQLYLARALPADVLYPKEQWLVEHCRKEAGRNRKTLIFLRQTGTRDIQPRVAGLLEKAGLRVRILRREVPPAQREDWVKRETPRCDVLVCNPKLVETGLDLLAYPTIVFGEIEYSLYTLMQSARRSWRLGQTEPVEVYWLAYRNTMEHRAIALVGEKIAAASLIYGDEAAAALAIQAGAGRSMLQQLAQEVIQGAAIQDLTDLFVQASQSEGWLSAAGTDGSLTLWTEETAAPVESAPEREPQPAMMITVAPPPEGLAQLSFFDMADGTAQQFTWVEKGRRRR